MLGPDRWEVSGFFEEIAWTKVPNRLHFRSKLQIRSPFLAARSELSSVLFVWTRMMNNYTNNHTKSNPELLLAEAKAGDQLEPLLNVYGSYLKVLARLQIGAQLQGKLDPSDVVQETFLRAHQTFGNFQGTTEQEFLSWLRKILAHVLAKIVRRYYGTQSRDPRLEHSMDQQVDRSSQALNCAFVDNRPSPSEHVMRREHAVILADALEQLPGDYRDVLLYRHVQELTFPEIARYMDRSLDSVKNLWARALSRIKSCVEVIDDTH